MDLDAGAVDEQAIGHIFPTGQRAEDPFPNPALGPAHEAVVERLLRSVDVARAIGPAPAAFQRVDDAAQHPAIIDTIHAPHVSRQQRLDPSPLCIRKPKEISHLPTPPAQDVESHSSQQGNPVNGSGP
jgi:hypothetical protein